VTSAQLIRVVLWMTGTLLSFSVMAVSVRELAGGFSIFEILTIRSGLGLVITVAAGLLYGMRWRDVTPRRLDLHVLRNGTHFASQFLWALSLTLLPLATVFALEFTMPLWTTLLAALFLGERLTPSRLGAMACGLIGVTIILRPGFEAFKPAAFLVLAAAFGYATSNIATKKLTAIQSTYTIVLWMNLMQLPMAYAGSDPLFFLKIGAANLLPVLGVGIAGLTAHFCLTNALAAGDASVVIPLDFMRLPLIAFVGWALYSERLDVMVFVGAAAIIAGVLWNLKSESRARPAKQLAAVGQE
jgi:drug/metabolite transporter (DMT)-like permease